MKPNYKNSALSKSEVGKLFLARLEEEMKEENADEMDETVRQMYKNMGWLECGEIMPSPREEFRYVTCKANGNVVWLGRNFKDARAQEVYDTNFTEPEIGDIIR